ncbi:MAG: hydrogen gas-evolving membrane-bound hydrogenase subunit E [Desulfatiglandaceae bacterium]
MKTIKIVILILFFSVLAYGTVDLPYRGDPDNLMHRETSITGTPVAGNYYIRKAYEDAKTYNMVTVVLADYRGVDTLGEQVVIYSAGLITLLILRRNRRR